MRAESEITLEALTKFAATRRGLLCTDPEVLVDTTRLLHTVAGLSTKVLPLKAYLDLVRQMQANESKHEASEDVFMLAAAWLELEVSKQGSVTYLKGESPDFRETKLARMPFDLTDTVVLKDLSAGLGRPNESRGDVERSTIDAAHNHLVRAVHRQQLLPHLVRRLNNGMRKPEVIKEFRMTHTDFDAVVRMARRLNLLQGRREKDPDNSYELSAENHAYVVEVAAKRGMAPRRALNLILDDWRAVLRKRGLLSSSAGESNLDAGDDTFGATTVPPAQETSSARKVGAGSPREPRTPRRETADSSASSSRPTRRGEAVAAVAAAPRTSRR